MRKKNRKSKLGLAPGTLIFTGDDTITKMDISVIKYSESEYTIQNFDDIDSVIKSIESYDGNSWININGLNDIVSIEKICTYLGVHKLTIEDILSVDQRPKIEEHSNYLHLSLKMLTLNPETQKVENEQISFILKNRILITFQEKEGDVFDNVRKRIVKNSGYVRKNQADYLLYALIDSVVDYYFLLMEIISEKLDELEIELFEEPDNEILNKIHEMRKEILGIRRSVYPLREVVKYLQKLEGPVFSENLGIFISDLYDHILRVIDTIEIYRDTSSGLIDLYMNSVSNKMNEVMKVLTIIATIFIPLTFIAGIYGMNFEYMPELKWRYSYFAVWGAMIIAFIGMLIFFKKKKWF